jgi:hypothetical protein
MIIVKAIQFNSQTVISISPCDLIKCKEGFLLKRGANFLLIKNDKQIQAINYLYRYFSGEYPYGVIRETFAHKLDDINIDTLLVQLYNSHIIEAIEQQDSIMHKFTDSEKLFFEQLGLSIQQFQKQFLKNPVLMVGEHLIFAELESMLSKYGNSLGQKISYGQALASDFKTHLDGATPSIITICSLDGKADILLELNAICKERHVTFLPIILRDAFCYIGPLVQPAGGPCFECSLKRYNANHKFMSEIYNNAFSGAFPLSEHAAKYIAAMIFQVCINLISKQNSLHLGSIIEMNINTFSVIQKQILVTPDCSVCH